MSAELLAYLESLKTLAYWRKGGCLAYGNVSYSALADAVKAQCEILEDDPPEAAAQKVRVAVEELFGDDAIAPQVRALVGAEAEDAPAFSREELFEAWRRFLERMAARLPLVLVLKDVHWADAGLLDFVNHLADWGQGPILILTLARPELLDLRPGWGGGKRNYAAIYLDPLTPAENSAMLEDLLGSALPDELRHLVAERSEGNPLYTEEIVRMFIDHGVLRATDASRWELAQAVGDVEVPRSIQALIATRLDGLPPDEKDLLQDAAVVGRSFWAGALQRLSGRAPEAVRDALGRLRVKEILTPREPPVFAGELEMAFRHVLIRDVAYESLPKTLRSAKHVEVARWAEERAGDRAEELAEVVAAHYLQAIAYQEELDERPDREVDAAACRWLSLAGDRALRLWQQAEAYRWYHEAVRLGERGDLPAEELARLTESAAEASRGYAPFEESAQVLRTALGRFEALGDQLGMARMEAGLADVHHAMARPEEAQRWGDRAVERLEPFGDTRELAATLAFLGNFHRREGRVPEAVATLERALEMATRLGEELTAASAALSLGIARLHVGDVPGGMAMIEQGYAAAQEGGQLDVRLRAANSLASCLMDYAPDYPRGWEVLWRAIEVCQRSSRRDLEGWLWQNVGNYGLDQGRIDEIEQAAHSAREIGEALSYPLILVGADYCQGVAEFLRGDLDAADAGFDRAIAGWAESKELQALPYAYALKGDIEEARGHPEEAIEAYRRGVESAEGELMLGMVDEVLFRLVRSLALTGRTDEARRPLEDLRTVAPGRPNTEAVLAWAEGMVAGDPAVRVERLRTAALGFERIGRVVDEARCLIDLAAALEGSGQDPSEERGRAAELLRARGIRVYQV